MILPITQYLDVARDKWASLEYLEARHSLIFSLSLVGDITGQEGLSCTVLERDDVDKVKLSILPS